MWGGGDEFLSPAPKAHQGPEGLAQRASSAGRTVTEEGLVGAALGS